MKILWVSTIPSHPATGWDQLIGSLGSGLKEKGYENFFLYCGVEGTPADKYREMKRFWPRFLYLPLLPKRIASLDDIDLEKFRTALALVADDYDIIIFNYLFLEPAITCVARNKLVICIPLLQTGDIAEGYISLLQSEWLNELDATQKTSLFHDINLVIARTRAEKELLADVCADQASFFPDILSLQELSNNGSSFANELDSIIKSRSRRFLLFLDYPFWDVKWGGYAQYIRVLIEYLKKRYLFSIVYRDTWGRDEQGRSMVKDLGLENNIEYLSDYLESSKNFSIRQPVNYPMSVAQNYDDDQYRSFVYYISKSPHFEIVMVLGILNSYFIDAVSYPVLSLLNIPDLWGLRHYLFKGRESNKITAAEEMGICDKFDGTILIEPSETKYIRRNSSKTIPVCCNFSFPCKKLPMPEKGIHFGFIAPEHIYEPIAWFLENIWPFQDRADARLHLFGKICDRFSTPPPKTILHGVLESEERIHSYCHVMLNPAILATGMSTKTVMALAYGRPVLATPRGARGFEHVSDSGIYTAYSRAKFIQAMWLFSHDQAMLQAYSEAAIRTAQSYLTLENSFKNLAALIESY